MKKRLYLLTCILFVGISCMFGQTSPTLSVADVTMPKNKTVKVVVTCELDKDIKGFQFFINFKKGINATTDLTIAESSIKKRFYDTDHTVSFNYTEGQYRFVVTSTTSNNIIPQKTTSLLSFEIGSDGSLSKDDIYTATFSNIRLTYDDNSQATIPDGDVTFNVTIGEDADWDILLDEESTVAPTTTSGEVKIKVHRTMKAGIWSTICLPFAMTEDEVIDVFGEGTEIAYFNKYTTNSGDEITSISIVFNDLNLKTYGLLANYPFIIKTTKDVSEFEISKTISSTKLNSFQYTEGDAPFQTTKGSCIGTYVAETIVPENSLFLNNNKFYYSTGKTRMKAFRAYFTFNDVLSSDNSAGARISFSVNGEETNVEDAEFIMTENGRIYSISGQYRGMSNENKNLPKGLYIMNGKKMIVK